MFYATHTDVIRQEINHTQFSSRTRLLIRGLRRDNAASQQCVNLVQREREREVFRGPDSAKNLLFPIAVRFESNRAILSGRPDIG